MSETTTPATPDPAEAILSQIADNLLDGLAEGVAIELGDSFPEVDYEAFLALESRVYAKLAAHFAAVATAL